MHNVRKDTVSSMKVRSFRGYTRPKGKIKRGHGLITFRGEDGKKPRRVLAVALGVLAVIVLAFLFRAEPVLMNSAEVATVWDHGVLRVGVRTDVPGMAENGEGYETELAALLADKIMSANPDWDGTTAVELVPVTPMDVSAKLSDGSIDVAICLMPAGVSDTCAYSRAYYTDAVYFLTLPGEESRAIKNIRIGCIQNASSTSLYVPSGAVYNVLTAYIDAHPDDGLATTTESGTVKRNITVYASYEDLFKGLESGEVQAVVLNGLMLQKYAVQYSFGISPTKAGSIDYAVACLAENAALASVADLMLADMEQDGTLEAMKTKYGSN
jgi:putative glutamine transport system substrate-binding protein